MKKVFKIITAIIILTVLTVSIVIMKKYTDIFGAPEYLYMDDCPVKDFKKVDEVEELELWYPSQNTLKNLKYCGNLKRLKLITTSLDPKLENLDFISDMEITYFHIRGECRDWSKISTLTHLYYLNFSNSDFDDVSLLREMSELRYLHINSHEIVDLSGIGELPELDILLICAPNDDISEIYQSTVLTSLIIYDCPNIKDISFLKNMDSIKELRLHRLTIEDYSFLTEMKGLENVDIEISNMQIEDEIINKLQDKGVTVTYE